MPVGVDQPEVATSTFAADEEGTIHTRQAACEDEIQEGDDDYDNADNTASLWKHTSVSNSELCTAQPHTHLRSQASRLSFDGPAIKAFRGLSTHEDEAENSSSRPGQQESPTAEKRKSPVARSVISSRASEVAYNWAEAICTHEDFQLMVVVLIFLNIVLLAMYDPTQLKKSEYNTVLGYIGIAFNAVFTLEVILHMIMAGGVRAYLLHGWNMFDFAMVLLGYSMLIPEASKAKHAASLKALKALRALAPLRTITHFQSLRTIVMSFLAAIPMLVSAAGLLMFLLFVCAVVGVTLLHNVYHYGCYHPEHGFEVDPTGNDQFGCGFRKCPANYTCTLSPDGLSSNLSGWDNVGQSMLTLFGCVALRSGWSYAAYRAADAVFPSILLFFVFVSFFGGFFMRNLFVAVLKTKFATIQAQMFQQARETARLRPPSQTQLGRFSVVGNFKNYTMGQWKSFWEKADSAENYVAKVVARHASKKANRLSKHRHSSGSHHRSTCSTYGSAELTHLNDLSEEDFLQPAEEQKVKEGLVARGDPDATRKRAILGNAQKSGLLPTESGLQKFAEQMPYGGFDYNYVDEEDDVVYDYTVDYWEPVIRTVQDFDACTEEYPFLERTWLRCCYRVRIVVQHRLFEQFFLMCIIANMVILAADHHNMSKGVEQFVVIGNTVLSILFALEMILKVIGLGIWDYIKDRFNSFDALIAVISVMELVLSTGAVMSAVRSVRSIRILRTLRVMRLFKMFRYLQSIQRIGEVLGNSLDAFLAIAALLALFLVVQAIVGLHVYGGHVLQDEFPNFDSFFNSFVLNFKVLTLEAWTHMMASVVWESNHGSIVYFVVWILVGKFIVLALFLAVILDAFEGRYQQEVQDTSRRLMQKQLNGKKMQSAIENIIGKDAYAKLHQEHIKEQMPLERSSLESLMMKNTSFKKYLPGAFSTESDEVTYIPAEHMLVPASDFDSASMRTYDFDPESQRTSSELSIRRNSMQSTWSAQAMHARDTGQRGGSLIVARPAGARLSEERPRVKSISLPISPDEASGLLTNWRAIQSQHRSCGRVDAEDTQLPKSPLSPLQTQASGSNSFLGSTADPPTVTSNTQSLEQEGCFKGNYEYNFATPPVDGMTNRGSHLRPHSSAASSSAAFLENVPLVTDAQLLSQATKHRSNLGVHSAGAPSSPSFTHMDGQPVTHRAELEDVRDYEGLSHEDHTAMLLLRALPTASDPNEVLRLDTIEELYPGDNHLQSDLNANAPLLHSSQTATVHTVYQSEVYQHEDLQAQPMRRSRSAGVDTQGRHGSHQRYWSQDREMSAAPLHPADATCVDSSVVAGVVLGAMPASQAFTTERNNPVFMMAPSMTPCSTLNSPGSHQPVSATMSQQLPHDSGFHPRQPSIPAPSLATRSHLGEDAGPASSQNQHSFTAVSAVSIPDKRARDSVDLTPYQHSFTRAMPATSMDSMQNTAARILVGVTPYQHTSAGASATSVQGCAPSSLPAVDDVAVGLLRVLSGASQSDDQQGTTAPSTQHPGRVQRERAMKGRLSPRSSSVTSQAEETCATEESSELQSQVEFFWADPPRINTSVGAGPQEMEPQSARKRQKCEPTVSQGTEVGQTVDACQGSGAGRTCMAHQAGQASQSDQPGHNSQTGQTSQAGHTSQTDLTSKSGLTTQTTHASQTGLTSQTAHASQTGLTSQTGHTSQTRLTSQAGHTGQTGHSGQTGPSSQASNVCEPVIVHSSHGEQTSHRNSSSSTPQEGDGDCVGREDSSCTGQNLLEITGQEITGHEITGHRDTDDDCSRLQNTLEPATSGQEGRSARQSLGSIMPSFLLGSRGSRNEHQEYPHPEMALVEPRSNRPLSSRSNFHDYDLSLQMIALRTLGGEQPSPGHWWSPSCLTPVVDSAVDDSRKLDIAKLVELGTQIVEDRVHGINGSFARSQLSGSGIAAHGPNLAMATNAPLQDDGTWEASGPGTSPGSIPGFPSPREHHPVNAEPLATRRAGLDLEMRAPRMSHRVSGSRKSRGHLGGGMNPRDMGLARRVGSAAKLGDSDWGLEPIHEGNEEAAMMPSHLSRESGCDAEITQAVAGLSGDEGGVLEDERDEKGEAAASLKKPPAWLEMYEVLNASEKGFDPMQQAKASTGKMWSWFTGYSLGFTLPHYGHPSARFAKEQSNLRRHYWQRSHDSVEDGQQYCSCFCFRINMAGKLSWICLFCLPPSHWLRARAKRIVKNWWFEQAMVCCILASCVAMMAESPDMDPNSTMSRALTWMNVALTSMFTVEAIMQMVAYTARGYLSKGLCQLELFILLVSYIDIILQAKQLSTLKGFRALRVIRPLRALNRSEGMRLMMHAMAACVLAMGNVLLVVTLFFLVFGVLGVQLFSGRFYRCNDTTVAGKSECRGSFINPTTGMETKRHWHNAESNFDNILHSMFTLFIVASQNGYTPIVMDALAAREVDQQPKPLSNPASFAFFVIFIVVCSFIMMNLSAGIVLYQLKRESLVTNPQNFFLSPLQKQWRALVTKLYQLQPVIPPTTPTNPVRRLCKTIISAKAFDHGIMLVIVCNMAMLATAQYRESEGVKRVRECSNVGFSVVFVMEAALKIAGSTWKVYWRDHWNKLDFGLAFLAVLDIAVAYLSTGLMPVFRLLRVQKILRILRVSRVVKLIKPLKGLHSLVTSLFLYLPAFINIASLMFLIFFIYAYIGMIMFGNIVQGTHLNQHANFRDFYHSIATLWRISTLDDWSGIMYDCMVQPPHCSRQEGNCGVPVAAYLYFPTFVLLSGLVLINFFTAVMIEVFEVQAAQELWLVSPQMMDDYAVMFGRLTLGRPFISKEDLHTLLSQLRAPLGVGARMSDVEFEYKLWELNLVPTYASAEFQTYHFHLLLYTLMRATLGPPPVRITPELKDEATVLSRLRDMENKDVLQSVTRRQVGVLCSVVEPSTNSFSDLRENFGPRLRQSRGTIDSVGAPGEVELVQQAYSLSSSLSRSTTVDGIAIRGVVADYHRETRDFWSMPAPTRRWVSSSEQIPPVPPEALGGRLSGQQQSWRQSRQVASGLLDRLESLEAGTSSSSSGHARDWRYSIDLSKTRELWRDSLEPRAGRDWREWRKSRDFWSSVGGGERRKSVELSFRAKQGGAGRDWRERLDLRRSQEMWRDSPEVRQSMDWRLTSTQVGEVLGDGVEASASNGSASSGVRSASPPRLLSSRRQSRRTSDAWVAGSASSHARRTSDAWVAGSTSRHAMERSNSTRGSNTDLAGVAQGATSLSVVHQGVGGNSPTPSPLRTRTTFPSGSSIDEAQAL